MQNDMSVMNIKISAKRIIKVDHELILMSGSLHRGLHNSNSSCTTRSFDNLKFN